MDFNINCALGFIVRWST